MSELTPVTGQNIPPFNRSLDVLRTVVITHENTLLRADQLVRVGNYSFRDIQAAVRNTFETIAGSYPTNNMSEEPGSPYLSTEVRQTAKATRGSALLLERIMTTEDPKAEFVMMDKDGYTMETDQVALSFYTRPYTEAYRATTETALEPQNLDSLFFYSKLEFFSPAENKVQLKNIFSLLEGGFRSVANTGFFDWRDPNAKWDDTRVFGVNFRHEPTLKKFRYLWKGLRWMSANLIGWSADRIILPEDLDVPEKLALLAPGLGLPQQLALDEPMIGPITKRTMGLTDPMDEERARQMTEEILRKWSGEKVPDIDTEYDTDAANSDLRS